MKQIKYLLLAATAITWISANADTQNKYTLSKSYTVTINGTSNLHDWDETVGSVSGDGIVTWNGDGSFDLEAVNIKMEVRSIKSNEGSAMNNNTYKALKADNNPEIIFALGTQLKSIPASATGHSISAKVNLTIAGVTKAVDMTVTATGQAHGNISFEGTKTIKMTDFGITPPVALFGTLKTGDEITKHFKTVFVASN